nr:poly(3-hydroxyalkanoate) granule-associated protein PhaF [Pseudomonas aeruginosa]
ASSSVPAAPAATPAASAPAANAPATPSSQG